MKVMRRLMALAIVVATAVPSLGGQAPTPRAFLLVVDDTHIDFRETPRLRKLLQDLTKGARDEDTWALVTTGLSRVRLEPALGGTDVRAAVSRVTGNALAVRDQLDAFGDADHGAVVRRRVSVTDIVLGQAVSEIAERRAGPLSILYLTDGYDARMVPGMSEFVREVAESRARLVVIPVRDLVPAPEPPPGVRPDEWNAYLDATRQSIRTLVEQTGGTAVFSKSELDAAIARLTEPAR